MRHSYLTRKDIYFAIAEKQITKQESRELIRKLDICSKSAAPSLTKSRSIVNEIDMRRPREFGSYLLKKSV